MPRIHNVRRKKKFRLVIIKLGYFLIFIVILIFLFFSKSIGKKIIIKIDIKLKNLKYVVSKLVKSTKRIEGTIKK